MAFTQAINVSGSDAFLTTLKNALTSSGWQVLEINTSSVSPPNMLNGIVGREIIFRSTGSVSDPTRFYISAYRHTYSSNSTNRIGFITFTGAKNFDNPVSISSLSRSSGGSLIFATSNEPHNLEVGDTIIINGADRPEMNEGWSPNTSHGPIQGAKVFSVATTSSFTYFSNYTTANTASGGNVLAVYNVGGDRSTAAGQGIDLILTGSISIHMYHDAFRACGIVSQSNALQTFYIGETSRDHIPLDFRGRAYISTNIGSGSVTASLDRNVENIRVGQKICFICPSGSAGTGSFERTTITSKPTSSSFGCVLANSYPSGTLVGEDPVPSMVLGVLGGNPSSNLSLNQRDINFIFYNNCTRDELNPRNKQIYFANQPTGLTEADIDPDAMDYLNGRYIFVRSSTAPTGIRRLVGFVTFPIGPQSNKDIITTGASGSGDYQSWPSSTTMGGSFSLAIGPMSS